jgi:hypothetical protein
MKKHSKKLVLARQILRQLGTGLELVAGGRMRTTVNTCPKYSEDCFPSGNVEC